jgi:hypothetical protein
MSDQTATERNTEYRRQWRKDPINKATEKARKRAEQKALRDLAHRYRPEFRELYEAHLVPELHRARTEMIP